MAENLSPEHEPRRVFLRFRTKDDAPSDLQIIQDFYALKHLNDQFCFVHWQSREERYTYVIVDVHWGIHRNVSRVQDLPHELYQLSWKPEIGTINFDALESETHKKMMVQFTTIFSWCS